MEKEKNRFNDIYNDRKSIKAEAHKRVKSHYVFLLTFCMIMALFGGEYKWMYNSIKLIYENYISNDKDGSKETGEKSSEKESPDDKKNESSSIGERYNILQILDFNGVLERYNARLAANKEVKEDNTKKKKVKNRFLAREEGVFAKIVNEVSSGDYLITIGNFGRRIFSSKMAEEVFVLVLMLLIYLLVYVFFTNFFLAVYTRMFLEARTYEAVPYKHALFISSAKEWILCSLSLGLRDLFLSFWSLTVIGGIIKNYSYAMVDYIVAENPRITPLKAINLSRRMMNGHKLEYFKIQLTIIPWYILGLVTLGISEIFYGMAYRNMIYSEFYARLRAQAKEEGMEDSELLNDTYLFEVADKITLYENYFDIVDDIVVSRENQVTLSKPKKILSEWLGIWIGSSETKKVYDEVEGQKANIALHRAAMDGKIYPQRLGPRWKERKLKNFNFLRSYTIPNLFLMFMVFSFIGWTWEVGFHIVEEGRFVNRGYLLGPWLPIYGAGGVVALMLCTKFRKNILTEFFSAIVICGIIEYFTAYIMETVYHQRWWFYDGYFLNIHGRVCAEGLLVFGVGCVLMVYLIAPGLDYLFSKIKKKVLVPLCIALCVIFVADLVVAVAFKPNNSSTSELMKDGVIVTEEKQVGSSAK